MTLLAVPDQLELDPTATADDENCREAVRQLIASLTPNRSRIERRATRRFPYPYLVQITPVDDAGIPQPDDGLVVVGKHLSESGIGFYHQDPLPFRRVSVALGTPHEEHVHLLMDLTWCRFIERGWYVSGGRFIDTL